MFDRYEESVNAHTAREAMKFCISIGYGKLSLSQGIQMYIDYLNSK